MIRGDHYVVTPVSNLLDSSIGLCYKSASQYVLGASERLLSILPVAGRAVAAGRSGVRLPGQIRFLVLPSVS